MKTAIFLIIFIVLMVLLGEYKGIKADLSTDGGYEPCKTSNHPLDVDC